MIESLYYTEMIIHLKSSPLPSFKPFMKGLSFFSYKMAPSVCLCLSVIHVWSKREIWNTHYVKLKSTWSQGSDAPEEMMF